MEQKIYILLAIILFTILIWIVLRIRSKKDRIKALCEAASEGNCSKIIDLLNKKVDINCKHEALCTPLHAAVFSEKIEAVKLLLDRGEDVNTLGAEATTISISIQKNSVKRKKDLVIKGLPDGRDRPIHFAAFLGNMNIVSLLIERKASVKICGTDGQTPLHWSASNISKEIPSLLIKSGADVNAINKRGETPLHFAARNGSLEIAELLIGKGADVNAKTKDGHSPFYSAVSNLITIVKIVIPDSTAIDRIPANYDVIKDLITMLSILLNKGADVNVADKRGMTPLHQACLYGVKELVEFLHHNNANIDIKNEDDKTPIDYAVQNGFTEIAEMLHSSGG